MPSATPQGKLQHITCITHTQPSLKPYFNLTSTTLKLPLQPKKSDELNHRSYLYFTSYNIFLPYVTFLIPLTKISPKGLSSLLNILLKSLAPFIVLIAELEKA